MVDFHSATKLIQQTDKLVLWYGIKHWLDEVIDVSIFHVGKPERNPPIHFQIRLVVHNHSFTIIVKGKFQVVDFFFLLSFNEFTDAVVDEMYPSEKMNLKDVLLPLCKQKKAYLFQLD